MSSFVSKQHLTNFFEKTTHKKSDNSEKRMMRKEEDEESNFCALDPLLLSEEVDSGEEEKGEIDDCDA